jgi:hypothetical protein
VQPADSPVRSRFHPKSLGNPRDLATDRFYHLPHVVSTRAGDAVVLMDSKRGTYYTLNEVGGRVWDLIGTGATTSEVVGRLLAEYEVVREQLETDVAATLRQLIDDRLAVRGQASNSVPAEPPPKPSPTLVRRPRELRVPSLLRCGLLIGWFKTLLRVQGFLGTLEWIRERVVSVRATSDAEVAAVQAVEYAVAMAGAFYPGRAKCLEQSLTLYYLLRRHGIAAVYRQGVQAYPFQAHAWVEYRGEVINDVAEHIRHFARLPEQLP